ncbi:MAG: hypothetical protein U0Q12_17180 [Vicinamibacterales bacterium]
MTVRFVSSLTPEDEARLAPLVLQVCGLVLGQFPIVYNLRVETSGDLVFQHSSNPVDVTTSQNGHVRR